MKKSKSIITQKDLGMVVPQNQLNHRPISDIQYFIIHHSVGPQTQDITEVAAEEETSQGFVTVGYHCIVRLNPQSHKWEIQEGRTIDDIPAAAYGLNEQSYDICILGNYQPNVPNVPTNTVSQDALTLVKERALLVKSKAKNLKYLIGHRDVATIMTAHGGNSSDYSTACPGDLLYAFMHNLRLETELKSPTEIL